MNAESIGKRYYEGTSTRELAYYYGCDEQTIRKKIQESSYYGKPGRKKPQRQRLNDLPEVSELVRQIGVTLASQRVLTKSLSLRFLSRRARVSTLKISALERGKFDPTINQLERLCKELDLELEIRMTPRDT